MKRIDITGATVNILLEVEGEIHLVAMEQDELDAISFLTKRASKEVIKTGKSQAELLEFLNYNPE